ncbi:unnamed protein product [Didymodactylos carnosus]|uniref:Uncharacterized protein n=1 Tax=Didymodactylos carnosus TaxID=1234261 RepID=A0A8S2CR79_9BILA|nr:unnamed protein product [Didymodactylos carnosus]CAF3498445.1 unnamed protein product [Didymodactylos carnosus]
MNANDKLHPSHNVHGHEPNEHTHYSEYTDKKSYYAIIDNYHSILNRNEKFIYSWKIEEYDKRIYLTRGTMYRANTDALIYRTDQICVVNPWYKYVQENNQEIIKILTKCNCQKVLEIVLLECNCNIKKKPDISLIECPCRQTNKEFCSYCQMVLLWSVKTDVKRSENVHHQGQQTNINFSSDFLQTDNDKLVEVHDRDDFISTKLGPHRYQKTVQIQVQSNRVLAPVTAYDFKATSNHHLILSDKTDENQGMMTTATDQLTLQYNKRRQTSDSSVDMHSSTFRSQAHLITTHQTSVDQVENENKIMIVHYKNDSDDDMLVTPGSRIHSTLSFMDRQASTRVFTNDSSVHLSSSQKMSYSRRSLNKKYSSYSKLPKFLKTKHFQYHAIRHPAQLRSNKETDSEDKFEFNASEFESLTKYASRGTQTKLHAILLPQRLLSEMRKARIESRTTTAVTRSTQVDTISYLINLKLNQPPSHRSNRIWDQQQLRQSITSFLHNEIFLTNNDSFQTRGKKLSYFSTQTADNISKKSTNIEKIKKLLTSTETDTFYKGGIPLVEFENGDIETGDKDQEVLPLQKDQLSTNIEENEQDIITINDRENSKTDVITPAHLPWRIISSETQHSPLFNENLLELEETNQSLKNRFDFNKQSKIICKDVGIRAPESCFTHFFDDKDSELVAASNNPTESEHGQGRTSNEYMSPLNLELESRSIWKNNHDTNQKCAGSHFIYYNDNETARLVSETYITLPDVVTKKESNNVKQMTDELSVYNRTDDLILLNNAQNFSSKNKDRQILMRRWPTEKSNHNNKYSIQKPKLNSSINFLSPNHMMMYGITQNKCLELTTDHRCRFNRCHRWLHRSTLQLSNNNAKNDEETVLSTKHLISSQLISDESNEKSFQTLLISSVNSLDNLRRHDDEYNDIKMFTSTDFNKLKLNFVATNSSQKNAEHEQQRDSDNERLIIDVPDHQNNKNKEANSFSSVILHRNLLKNAVFSRKKKSNVIVQHIRRSHRRRAVHKRKMMLLRSNPDTKIASSSKVLHSTIPCAPSVSISSESSASTVDAHFQPLYKQTRSSTTQTDLFMRPKRQEQYQSLSATPVFRTVLDDEDDDDSSTVFSDHSQQQEQLEFTKEINSAIFSKPFRQSKSTIFFDCKDQARTHERLSNDKQRTNTLNKTIDLKKNSPYPMDAKSHMVLARAPKNTDICEELKYILGQTSSATSVNLEKNRSIDSLIKKQINWAFNGYQSVVVLFDDKYSLQRQSFLNYVYNSIEKNLLKLIDTASQSHDNLLLSCSNLMLFNNSLYDIYTLQRLRLLDTGKKVILLPDNEKLITNSNDIRHSINKLKRDIAFSHRIYIINFRKKTCLKSFGSFLFMQLAPVQLLSTYAFNHSGDYRGLLTNMNAATYSVMNTIRQLINGKLNGDDITKRYLLNESSLNRLLKDYLFHRRQIGNFNLKKEIGYTVLLWCTVRFSFCMTQIDDYEHSSALGSENNDELNDDIDPNSFIDLYRRASLRHHQLYKKASLRPVIVQRASLRPSFGKRASLRPIFMGKRKRRSIQSYLDDE